MGRKALPYACSRDELGPCEECGAHHVELDWPMVRAGLRYVARVVLGLWIIMLVVAGAWTIGSWALALL